MLTTESRQSEALTLTASCPEVTSACGAIVPLMMYCFEVVNDISVFWLSPEGERAVIVAVK